MSRSACRAPSRRRLVRFAAAIAVAAAVVTALPRAATAQAPSREMLSRGHRMLAQIYKDLREIYFDPTFGGVDLEARYRAADSAITAAPTNNHIIAAAAQFVSELNDSHTRFYPPGHVANVDYGYQTTFVGDTCFITLVKANSDAAAKGVRRGDVLLKVDAFPAERASFPTVEYVYHSLSPRTLVRLTLRSPDGAQRTVDVASKVTRRERTTDYTDVETWRRLYDEADTTVIVVHRWIEIGDSVMVWRMSQFAGSDKSNIDDLMKKVGSRRALVLDLRDNGGGALVTLEYLLGHFFDQEVTIGAQRSRDGTKPWVVKPRSKAPYRGMVVVLLNSASASSSEIFARTMQLEGRAVIVGDRSRGAVVGSRIFPHLVGAGLEGRSLEYATQISVLDVVMPDGQRLEGVGVTPDHVVLPTAADIAARRDPQMAKALELVGMQVSPESAGTMFRARR